MSHIDQPSWISLRPLFKKLGTKVHACTLPANCIEEASFLSAIYSVTNLICQSSLTLLLANEYNSTPVGFSITSVDFSFIWYKQTAPQQKLLISKTRGSIIELLIWTLENLNDSYWLLLYTMQSYISDVKAIKSMPNCGPGNKAFLKCYHNVLVIASATR